MKVVLSTFCFYSTVVPAVLCKSSQRSGLSALSDAPKKLTRRGWCTVPIAIGMTKYLHRPHVLKTLKASIKIACYHSWWKYKPAYPQAGTNHGVTVEAWGSSPKNPVGGWYGLKKGFGGYFGNYVPPLLEELGLLELEHYPKNNRMKAKWLFLPAGAYKLYTCQLMVHRLTTPYKQE